MIYTYKDILGSWSTWRRRPYNRSHLDTELETIIIPKMEVIKREDWGLIQDKIVGGLVYHHHQALNTLIKEAQERWLELQLDEYEELFRFRLGGKRRIWGYRVGHRFHVVWWDPEHQIYKQAKKA